MKFTPTAQQQHIVDTALTGQDVIVQAYAGASKTTTLTLIAGALKDKRILYVAFNKAIAVEAAEKMPSNVECRTVHSVAYANTPKEIINKLRGYKPNNKHLIDELGVEGFDVYDPKANDTVYISALRLVGWVNRTTLRYMQSSDATLQMKHVYIDEDYSHLRVSVVKPMLFECAKKLWAKYINPKDKGVIPHDVYLKLFSLNAYHLGFDVVMLDESQDTSGVMVNILDAQQSQKIYVGDSFQKIYSFTGSIDISQRVQGVVCYLSKSFRFGNRVAAEANIILKQLGATLPLEGFGDDSVVEDYSVEPNVIICRTNSAVLETYIEQQAIHPDKKISVSCDTTKIKSFAEGLIELDKKGKTQHLMLRSFNSVGGFYQWLRVTDEDVDLETKNLASICRKIGANMIVDSLDNIKDYSHPDLLITTAHKSKGREWDVVQLGSDFPKPYTTDAEEEKRLFYVAVTRAKKVLNGVRYYKDDAGEEAVKFNFNKLIRSLENESYTD